jgi:flagellar biogenesis protein FliO
MSIDRRAHRKYTPEQIKRRALAIKKNRKKKKATKGEVVMKIFVVMILLIIFVVSYIYGIK